MLARQRLHVRRRFEFLFGYLGMYLRFYVSPLYGGEMTSVFFFSHDLLLPMVLADIGIYGVFCMQIETHQDLLFVQIKIFELMGSKDENFRLFFRISCENE